MKLVRLKHWHNHPNNRCDYYVNPERIDYLSECDEEQTNVWMSGEENRITVDLPIKAVVELLESNERKTHSCMNVVDEKGFPENLNRVLHDVFDEKFGGSEK